MMQNVKIGFFAAVSLLVLIIVLQNTESVDTRFLFFTITMPRAVLLFGALTAGFLLGMLTSGIRSAKRKEEKS